MSEPELSRPQHFYELILNVALPIDTVSWVLSILIELSDINFD